MGDKGIKEAIRRAGAQHRAAGVAVVAALATAVSDAGAPHYTWEGLNLGTQYKCEGYVPFAYDSVVVNALALDAGMTAGLFALASEQGAAAAAAKSTLGFSSTSSS